MTIDFEEIYQETKADLQTAELIRRKNLPWAVLGTLIILLAPGWLIYRMAFILIYNSGDDISEFTFIAVTLFTLIGLVTLRYFAFRSVQLIFRGKITPAIVNKIGEGFYYSQKGEVQKEVGEQSKLFPTFGIWDGDDHVQGKIDGDLFELSKLKLKTSGSSTASSGSKKSQSTVFKGVIIHMELSTSLPDPIWIIPKKAAFGYNFPQLKALENREVVKIDGLARGYKMHTTNSVVAKRLFSGNMLVTINEIIKDFKQKGITKKPIRFAFYENHVVIAFKRKKGVFHLSWMPLTTKIDSPAFIQKQLLVINSALRLREVIKG